MSVKVSRNHRCQQRGEIWTKEFVAHTLLQIIEGVSDAQERVPSGATINPRPTDGKRSERSVHNVAFDVAVTVSEGSEARAGAGLMIPAIGLGAHARKSEENTAINRIRFDVPISFAKPPRESNDAPVGSAVGQFDP